MENIKQLFQQLVDFLGSEKAIEVMTVIIDGIRNAQEVYGDATEGVIKKKAVMAAVDDVVDAVDIFYDPASDYANPTSQVIGEIIDAVVYAYNFSGIWGRKVHITWEGGQL